MKHKKSELTRARIIAAARPLFTEKGFDETSVAEICRESGVSNGALFHQFKVKEDIAFAVFSEVRGEFWDRVISAMVVHDDPLNGVEAAMRASFAYQQDNPGGAAFIKDITGAKWIENYAGENRELYDAGIQRGLAWARPHFESGHLPPISPDAFITLVSGAPQWIGRMIRIGMADSKFEDIADEMAVLIRRALTVR
ncbi:TetR/AcrR family transcriptional regulator [Novosphingobium sp.]|uniref:TetR/AcrR family transcriptional regulator n=1 Tax=Novosphingobium sp. TaxID=1874826 RepID=UPI00286D79EF|nr:TetR/AcrR family transcriptional regulator [Novosphingobium sp.]